MDVSKEISLAWFARELGRRTVLTFLSAAKLTLVTMLAAAALLATVSMASAHPGVGAVFFTVLGVVILAVAVTQSKIWHSKL
jgi:hypothetical protein